MSYENQLIREMTMDEASLSIKHGEADTDVTLAEEKESLFSKESDKLFEHAPAPKETEL